jgi:polysaccharide pyruvyl transferase WcaK-like protein
MAMKLDTLIIGPGGLLPNRDPGKILFFILLGLLMRIRRKKVGIVGLGIGSANCKGTLTRLLLNVLFWVMPTVVLRHDITSEMNLWKCSRKHVVMSKDYLLSDHDLFTQTTGAAGEKPTVAFAVADIFESNESERSRFVEGICHVISGLHDMGIGVSLISLSRRTDVVLNTKIAEHFPQGEITTITYGEAEEQDLCAAFGNASVVVAMRFHALVMALKYLRPVYAVAYSDKLVHLCKVVDAEQFMQKICVNEKLYFEKYISLNWEDMLQGIRNLINDPHQQTEKTKELLSADVAAITEAYDMQLRYLLQGR